MASGEREAAVVAFDAEAGAWVVALLLFFAAEFEAAPWKRDMNPFKFFLASFTARKSGGVSIEYAPTFFFISFNMFAKTSRSYRTSARVDFNAFFSAI